ncbi:hypothetical protein [Rhizobium sp. YTU87027]|uniref:hypothetical protein n=1 Tax=Rhizobium sp. YTU87027 TaxID=3417741 RepID=UPI003D69BE25
MKAVLVPHDIAIKHEIEWQALRAAADTQVELERSDIADSAGSRCASPMRSSSERTSPARA